ncbi:MAG: DUF1499 domain-containing protein [Gammaproteobacteria bacterium]
MMKMVSGLLLLLFLIITGLLAGALAANSASWNEPPGALKRLRIYLGTHVATTENSPLPELKPRRYPLTGERAIETLRQALAELGWVESAYDPERSELHAVVTTRLWRFKDDLRIWVEEEEEGAVIRAHSQSRLGKGDLGANARHILDLFETLDRIVGPDQGA